MIVKYPCHHLSREGGVGEVVRSERARNKAGVVQSVDHKRLKISRFRGCEFESHRLHCFCARSRKGETEWNGQEMKLSML
jgi:hypothetical protein